MLKVELKIINKRKILTGALILTAALFFGAEFLAEHFFNDMRVVMPLQITLALTLQRT